MSANHPDSRRLGIPGRNLGAEVPLRPHSTADASAASVGLADAAGTGSADPDGLPGRAHEGAPEASNIPVLNAWSRGLDTGLGRPSHIPQASERLSTEEFLAAEAREDEQARTVEARRDNPATWGWGAFSAGTVVWLGALGIFCVLALFVAAQVAATLATLAALPAWAQLLGYSSLCILACGVAASFGGLAWKFLRLRRNRQVSLGGLDELAKRGQTREDARNSLDTAVTVVRDYLRSCDFADGRQKAGWLALGFTESEYGALKRTRESLLSLDEFAGNRAWLDRYVQEFQGTLDRVANARIERLARRAALKTAISPNALLDTLIIAWLSASMMNELFRIYRVRMGGMGTAAVLAHLFFNIYVAGDLNELEGTVDEGVESMMHGFGEIAGIAVGKLAAKGTVAILNYSLLKRLGRSAVRLLQPVGPA